MSRVSRSKGRSFKSMRACFTLTASANFRFVSLPSSARVISSFKSSRSSESSSAISTLYIHCLLHIREVDDYLGPFS